MKIEFKVELAKGVTVTPLAWEVLQEVYTHLVHDIALDGATNEIEARHTISELVGEIISRYVICKKMTIVESIEVSREIGTIIGDM